MEGARKGERGPRLNQERERASWRGRATPRQKERAKRYRMSLGGGEREEERARERESERARERESERKRADSEEGKREVGREGGMERDLVFRVPQSSVLRVWTLCGPRPSSALVPESTCICTFLQSSLLLHTGRFRRSWRS